MTINEAELRKLDASLAATPAPFKSREVEAIYESWDGCMYDGIDIGAALRADFGKLAATPAPTQSAELADETALREAVAESLRGNYYCGRVWSAWGVGTMGEGDFAPSGEVGECIDQVMDAIRPFLAAPTAAPAQANGAVCTNTCRGDCEKCRNWYATPAQPIDARTVLREVNRDRGDTSAEQVNAVLAAIARLNAVAQPIADVSAPTELSKKLRKVSGNMSDGVSKLFRQAAEEIERLNGATDVSAPTDERGDKE